MARLRGEYDKAQAMLRRAAVLLQDQGDREGEAEALHSLATIARRYGDFTSSLRIPRPRSELSEERSLVRVKCGNTRGDAWWRWANGLKRSANSALHCNWPRSSDEHYARWIVHNLAGPPTMRGDFGEALRWIRRSLRDERNTAPMPQEADVITM